MFIVDNIKKTSEIKEGKGGADNVKKKARIIIKDIIGESKINPRIATNWRVPNIEYSKPTNIKRIGDLKPWKNISIKIPLIEQILFAKSIKGIVIIWETEE